MCLLSIWSDKWINSIFVLPGYRLNEEGDDVCEKVEAQKVGVEFVKRDSTRGSGAGDTLSTDTNHRIII
jgi:hypothetical protein